MKDEELKIHCFRHKTYKKGCADCKEANELNQDNGDWIHDPDMGDQ